MNLLSLILIAMALVVAGCVFYVAWQFSSGEFDTDRAKAALKSESSNKVLQQPSSAGEKEPDESK